MVTGGRKIVFFEKPNCGTVITVYDNNCSPVGSHHKNWDMDEFTDYNEPVTIKNK